MKYKVILLLFITCGLFVNTSAQETSTVSEIYDYDIGDVFHRRFYENYDGVWFETLSGITVVDKYYEPDSSILYYDIEAEKMERAYDEPEWEYSTYTNTSSYSNLDSLINNGQIDSVSTHPDLYNGRIINYYEHDNYPNTNNKWRYVNGCGRAYKSYHGYGFGNSVSELLYYNKGGEEWGEPIMLLGLDEKEPELEVAIYPNPVQDYLNINLTESKNVTATIFSANGKWIETYELNSNISSINVTDLKAGLHLLVINQDNTSSSIRFVKQ